MGGYEPTTTYRNLGPYPGGAGGAGGYSSYGPTGPSGPTGGTLMNAAYSPSFSRGGYAPSWEQNYRGPTYSRAPPQSGPSHYGGMEVVSVEYRDGGVLPPDAISQIRNQGNYPPPRY
jgi:hypothetical protein